MAGSYIILLSSDLLIRIHIIVKIHSVNISIENIFCIYCNDPHFSDKLVCANIEEPDQTSLLKVPTLFHIPSASL